MSPDLDSQVVSADTDQAGVDETSKGGGGDTVGGGIGGVGESQDLARDCVGINLGSLNI